MHPRIAINALSLGDAGFAAQVDTVARIGAAAITPEVAQFDHLSPACAARLLRDAGLGCAALTHRAFGFAEPAQTLAARERLARTISIAAEIGAPCVVMTTGGRGPLDWPEAAARFTDAIAPCAELARQAGVRLGIEPTSHLYADVSIVHRLADCLALARRAGIAVVIDLFACWTDADLAGAIAAAAPLTALVQVGDHAAGDRALPCRAVPGDGMVPLQGLVPAIIAAGYTGLFDLEIIGPRLAAEGVAAGLRRAGAAMGGWLGGARPA